MLHHSLLLKLYSKFFKSPCLEESVFKVYAELDLMFYHLNFGDLEINFVIEEDYLYGISYKGIPSVLMIQDKEADSHSPFIDIKKDCFMGNQSYVQLYFKYDRDFNTKLVTSVSSQWLYKIVFRKQIKLLGIDVAYRVVGVERTPYNLKYSYDEKY